MKYNVKAIDIGPACLGEIKRAPWFPYRSGNLKFNATRGLAIRSNLYEIYFDNSVAPYISALEEGSSPHNIPGAFGKPYPFGTSGRFDGKFHPGSTKHKGFISEKCVKTVVNYICVHYKGVCYDIDYGNS